MSVDSADLSRLSALLDEVIDLDAAGRSAWLARVGGEDAHLVPALQRMLAGPDGPETADLLERGPSLGAAGGEDETASVFKAGDLVGPYRLERQIGQGGMGEVWLAERGDGQVRRRVALKLPVLGARRSVLVQRFARERDILASLTHPNIARLYDAGLADDGQPYLALEYVDGQPISTYCETLRLAVRERVELLRQVLGAVQYAHANLVIHRDLKPSNVLVTPAGVAMLLDFGIAKLLQDDASEAAETELTRLGGRAMTLDYAAPEQITGAPISTATDVWALGALLYELDSGRKPFRRGSRSVQEQAILGEEPPAPTPRSIGRGIAAELDTIVLKALKKVPAERYATVNAFDEDLGRWLRGEPVLARPDGAWYRTRKFVGRNRVAIATAAGVAGVVIGASIVSIYQARIATEQTRIAQTEAKTAEAVQNFLEGIFRSNSGDQADPLKARQATAQELLDKGAARIDNELDDAPRAKLRVLKTLAHMYEDMGQLDAAAALHERRAALAERAFGEGDDEQLYALADLTNMRVFGGKVKEGGAIIRRAIALAERKGRIDDRLRIDLDLAMGGFFLVQASAEGLPYADRAASLTRLRKPDVKHLQVLNLLGQMQGAAGRHTQSRDTLQDAVRVGESLGSEAASVLPQAYAELAGAQESLRDAIGAEASMRRAVALATQNSGADSIQVAVYRVNLGSFLFTVGHLGASTAEYGAARDLFAAQPASPQRDAMLTQVAALQARAQRSYGHPAEALAELERLERDGLLEAHPGIKALMLTTSALCLVDLGRFPEAERRFDLARQHLERHRLASSDPGVTWEIARLALLKIQGPPAAAVARVDELEARKLDVELTVERAEVTLLAGDAIRAEALARKGLARFSPSASAATTAPSAASAGVSSRPPMTVESAGAGIYAARMYSVLGRALTAQGRAAEALTPLREVVALRAAQGDPALSPLLAAAHAALGEALLASHDLDGARRSLEAAKHILARHARLGLQFTDPVRRLQAAWREAAASGPPPRVR